MLESINLAVVQGLTEFLPVSSSGHLVLAQSLFGIFPGDALVYDVVLHLATALAAALFYRRELAGVVRGLVPPYRLAPENLAAARESIYPQMASGLHAGPVWCQVLYFAGLAFQ